MVFNIRTCIIGRTVLVVTTLLVLNACVYGVPMVDPASAIFLLGAQGNPQYWPFEEDPKILKLDCGGKPTEITASSNGATLIQTGEETKFQRDYSPDGGLRLRYYHRIGSDQNGAEPIVDEKSQPALIDQWLSVAVDLTVELEIDDIPVTCRQSRPEAKQNKNIETSRLRCGFN